MSQEVRWGTEGTVWLTLLCAGLQLWRREAWLGSWNHPQDLLFTRSLPQRLALPHNMAVKRTPVGVWGGAWDTLDLNCRGHWRNAEEVVTHKCYPGVRSGLETYIWGPLTCIWCPKPKNRDMAYKKEKRPKDQSPGAFHSERLWK